MSLQNERGFTLVEVIVASAIVLTTVLLSMSLISDVNKISKELTDHADKEADTVVTTMALQMGLPEIGPSFNRLLFKIDGAGRSFFDYFEGLPSAILGTMTLPKVDFSKPGEEFKFLGQNESFTDLVYFNPLDAYATPSAPANYNTPVTLTFSGLNQGQQLSIKYPELWKENALVLLRSPLSYHPIGKTGVVDMTKPAREYCFLGRVAGADLIPESLGGMFIARNPLNGLSISTVDQFLRELPASGGSSSFVILESVVFRRLVSVVSHDSAATQPLVDVYEEAWDPSAQKFQTRSSSTYDEATKSWQGDDRRLYRAKSVRVLTLTRTAWNSPTLSIEMER